MVEMSSNSAKHFLKIEYKDKVDTDPAGMRRVESLHKKMEDTKLIQEDIDNNHNHE